MKRKDILSILIPLSIVVLAWIVFSIHHSVVTSTISDMLSIQILPISPSFDVNTLANLKKRQQVTPLYQLGAPVQNFVIPATPSANITPTPTPIIITQPISSGSAQEASSGGTLSQ